MVIKRKASLDDGCNPELVAGAAFDGMLEIPVIHAPAEIVIPSGITPFTKREKAVGTNEAIGFFEKDPEFSKVLIDPAVYLEDFKRFRFLLPVDCSLYRDAPLAVQVTNLYRSRAIGSYYQRHGCTVYPLVRWGNELTSTRRSIFRSASPSSAYPNAALSASEPMVASTAGRTNFTSKLGLML